MAPRKPDGRSRTGFVVVAASLGLLVLTAVFAVAATRSFVSSSAWVDHTLDVRHEIAELAVAMWQAESSERGYVITGRAEYLAPVPTLVDRTYGYAAPVARIPAHRSGTPDRDCAVERADG